LHCFLEAVPLDVRQVLETPEHPIEHIYFVETGLVSVVGTTPGLYRIEVGMIGPEGMTGLAVVLGDDRSANETIVQTGGTALRISTEALRATMIASPALTAALLRYAHVFMMQESQTAVANGCGRHEERLARWLLMWRDRLRDEELPVTHEFLAVLLGVRRPAVTETIHILEGRGLIKASRRLLRIVDLQGLKEAANGLYGIAEAHYDRAFDTSAPL
jgi:CRP-like cAMP-binding protein